MNKKRIAVFALTVCMLVLVLAGCSGNVGSDNRDGVVRVMSMYDMTVYLVDASTGDSQRVGSGTAVGFGTAIGVGKAGKETEYYVTNRHVVEEMEDEATLMEGTIYQLRTFKRKNIYILLDNHSVSEGLEVDTSRSIPCDLLYQAPAEDADLAVLKAAEPVAGRKALPIAGEKLKIDQGDEVWALGYPSASEDRVIDSLGNQTYYADLDHVTVTNGTVSLHSSFNTGVSSINVIQHTANINHGNSGGPLLDKHGAVVGVNTWGINSDGIEYFFSIEIDYVRDVLDDLKIVYDIYNGPNVLLIVLIAVAAVLLIAGVVIALVVANKKKVPEEAPAVNEPILYRLQCTAGIFSGRRFAIEPGVMIRMGVTPGAGGLTFPEKTPGISRNHASVLLDGDRLTVTDLGSTYGTFVNGTKIAPNMPVEIHLGDRISLGSDQQSFVVTSKGGM